MKKTLILTSLIATMTAFAATKGNVEFFNENEFDNTKFQIKKLGVKSDIEIKNLGLSFGGEIKAEDLIYNNKDGIDLKLTTKKFADKSSVYVKYQLPDFKGLKTFVKGTFDPELENNYALKGKTKLEANVEYKLKDINLGFDSETEFPFKAETNKYKESAMSTQKVYAKGDISKVKGIDAELALNHSYVDVKKISGKGKLSYSPINKLELTANAQFLAAIKANELDYKDTFLGNKDLYEKADVDANAKPDRTDYGKNDLKETDGSGRYAHAYSLEAKYTGFDHLTLTGAGYLNLMHTATQVSIVPSVDFKVEYKALNDKLALEAKTTLGGYISKFNKFRTLLLALDTKVGYTFDINNKLSITPELGIYTKHGFNTTLNYTNKNTHEPTEPRKLHNNKALSFLTIGPKVNLNYKPITDLTFTASVEVPVNFEGYNVTDATHNFKYKSFSVKPNLNLKYEWK
ncbi:hypothetical protein [Sneathia sanguinegens]|uniref:hypothetical protein n=1 Tax=Sneathia sanguinegens TaxID=40543 RepID=UPI002913935B|nr:hypothetical protein [Sneathia sanguinegens]MDU7497255.1 hypothetical protein [Sneathia sanguinegens]